MLPPCPNSSEAGKTNGETIEANAHIYNEIRAKADEKANEQIATAAGVSGF